jgi:error-prone DNA polymerase
MFIHLHTHSPYSFLDGASPIEDMVRAAAHCGMPALALTDHNSTAAAVKFVSLCEGYGILPILGAEVTMEDETHLTLLAANREGYANLGRLLTEAYRFGGRLSPHTPWCALELYAQNIFCLSGCKKGLVPSLIRSHRYEEAHRAARRLQGWFGERFYIELQEDRDPHAHRVCLDLAELADAIGAPTVATNNVHYVRGQDYIGHDVLRSIATLTTLDQPHPDRPLNAERWFKTEKHMQQLFAWRPQAIANTLRIAEQCTTALPRSEEITPRYPVPNGAPAEEYLRYLAYKGATARYRGIEDKTRTRLDFELDMICTLGYADYFLMVWEIVRWARKNGIRATGRGSAADSCVAYALTLTDVDVLQRDLPFARFLVPGKLPDIDMDFPSEKRDDVFRYIIQKYGEDHTGMVCTFHTFWSRSAVRDVGKALSIPPDALNMLSKHLSSFIRADQIDMAFEKYAEFRTYGHLKERFRLLFTLCSRIAGFPRHLGTHSSGIVISRVPLATLAPLTPSARGLTQIWTLDKDDAEAIGIIKFDVLSLRTLSAVGDAEKAIAVKDPGFKYDRIPDLDPDTYAMLQSGSGIGTFQFESPAQLALAATLGPNQFEDLVASVALIRPGPIRGNGANRFVAARLGWARADVLHPCLEQPLAKTYGVIIFQEQVVQVVAAMLGIEDGAADKFRKSLARHHNMGTMEEARTTFVEGALRCHRDLLPETAHLLFDQLAGWCGYGFTEGHAASFALTGYRTAFLSVHHTAEYFGGLMNHMPAGYYNANTLAAEARRRGVPVLPVDINKSGDKCFPEQNTAGEGITAIRLGLRMTAELREEDIAEITAERERSGPYRSLLDFCVRVPLHRDRLENLILCGAFDSLHARRRGLLWSLEETIAMASSFRSSARDAGGMQTAIDIHLESSGPAATPTAWHIEEFSLWEQFLWTWRITGVCAECHVFTHLRSWLTSRNILSTAEAKLRRHGERVTVAGLNICPHRPPTRSGNPVLFTSIEDETAVLQAICVGEPLKEHTGLFLTTPAVIVRGIIEHRGRGSSLKIERAKALRITDAALRHQPAAGQNQEGSPEPERNGPDRVEPPLKVKAYGR